MMKAQLCLTVILLVATVLGAAVKSSAQNPGIVAGRIVSVKCRAFLKKNGTQEQVALRSPQDIGLPLSAGDQVQCVGTGYLEVLISEGTKTIKASPKWFAIPLLPPVPMDSKEDNAIAKALRDYGISGATRGNADGLRILWPSENSAIVPEHFVIRWAPVSQKIVVSILSEAKDVSIWGPTEIDGSAGSLQLDAVSAALADYKMKSGSPGVVLTITFANPDDWEETHFSLLGGRQEQELNSELDFWAKHADGLALHLGRGYTFLRNRLFDEAAEEYESALNTAPESRYLLQHAIEADRFAGRSSRVKELQARLASSPKATIQ